MYSGNFNKDKKSGKGIRTFANGNIFNGAMLTIFQFMVSINIQTTKY
jgi:hypothetical protein